MPNFDHFTLSNLFLPKCNKIQNTQFWLFCIFSNQSGPKQFEMPNFGHFTLFLIFSYQSDIKSFRTLNFSCSAPFPTKVVQNDLGCSILVISHFFEFFPTKVVKMIWNAQFSHFALFPIFFHQSDPK